MAYQTATIRAHVQEVSQGKQSPKKKGRQDRSLTQTQATEGVSTWSIRAEVNCGNCVANSEHLSLLFSRLRLTRTASQEHSKLSAAGDLEITHSVFVRF